MYHFKKPEGLVGTISNLDVFLHRGLDTGFGSKWSGLWKPGYKLLDYYSYKVNGIWLDSSNLQAVDYGDGIKYYFETESLHIEEKITTPEGFSGAKSRLKLQNKLDERKAVHVVLEAGADIRKRDEDIPEPDYSVKRDSSRVEVRNEKELKITSNRELDNSGEAYLKEHYPGEKQECLIPGEISVKAELGPQESAEIEFRFSSGKASDKNIQRRKNELESDHQRVFEASIKSMENLIYDSSGLGIIAGHPWFQNYWARDSFWSLLGLIDAGYFEEAEDILQNFAEKGVPGKINVEGEDEEEIRADTYPLFILAADKLRRHYKISENIESAMDEAFNNLETDGKGVVEHDPNGTWMDTLERPKAVDIQALWLKAAEIMEDETKEKELQEGLKEYNEEKGILDHLGDNPAQTVNPSVPLMFEFFDSDSLSKINAEFSSRFGARTRAVTDPGYSSSGYHTGSTWGLTSMWAAAANFRHGKTVEGLNFLENFSNFLDKDQPGALPEVVDSENSENLGCLEQAWSAGMMVHVIDSYLLGIEVDEDKIRIDPCDDYSGKRLQKRVGEGFLDLKVENGEAEVLNKEGIDREVIL